MKKEKQNKKKYLAPSWRVVSFKTERGVFTSFNNVSPTSASRYDAGEQMEEAATTGDNKWF